MTFQTHWTGVPLGLAPPQGGNSYHSYKLEKDSVNDLSSLCEQSEHERDPRQRRSIHCSPLSSRGHPARLDIHRTPHPLRE